MNRRCVNSLPRFRMFNAFFGLLRGGFEPLRISEAEKRAYVQALKNLGGSPLHLFRQLRDDLDLTARVREARRYDGNRFYIRFDFFRMTKLGWTGMPIQLMVIFNGSKDIVSYTVVRERGRMENGIAYVMTKADWNRHEEAKHIPDVLEFLANEKEGEVYAVDAGAERKEDSSSVVDVCRCGDGNKYDVKWHLACDPWLLTVKNVDLDCVKSVLMALENGGVKELEKVVEWMPFDFIEDYCKNGVPFDIDTELRRYLERAKRDGDAMVEETIRAVGVSEASNDRPYRVWVEFGSNSCMLDRLYGEADPERKDGNEALKARCTAYLALRDHMWSIHNLGWRFHFGKGVPVDIQKAIYWQEKSAAMGDALSMQNLGKIYSEKNSPVHDCSKAAAWFEKAIAEGETWAMENLAHCLLCGENGKDVARALELSKMAVEANPDNVEFKETYEQALKASRGEGE